MVRRRRGEEEEESTFAETPETQQPAQRRLGPVDVQQKVFRLAFRGYNERDVDEFLDHVTETLGALHEENKRLRESLQDAGGAPAAIAGSPGQAEEIVRRAREHAARLVEDAERRAAEIRASAEQAAPAPSAASELPAQFLTKERDFLKRLAAMVQDHARSLKEEVARSRAEGAGEPERVAPQASALAFAQRAVEDEDRSAEAPGTSAALPASQPTPAEAAAERMPPETQRRQAADTSLAVAPSAPLGGAASVPSDTPPGADTAEPDTAEPAADLQAPPQRSEPEEKRPGPWGPATRDTGSQPVPGLADHGERRDADPLISAWESAFLGGGPETETEPAPAAPAPSAPSAPSAPAPSPSPGPVPSGSDDEGRRETEERDEKRGEEPSLKELFWGEQ